MATYLVSAERYRVLVGESQRQRLLVAAAALIVGLLLLLFHGNRVREVRVTKHGALPAGLIEAPDYYVVVQNRSGNAVRTNGYVDIPIGNGLTFKLPAAMSLSDISRIYLLDADILDDDVIEQAEVHGPVSKGQAYQFELTGPTSLLGLLGTAASISGGGYLVYAGVMLVRANSL